MIDRCRQLLQTEKKIIGQLFKLTELFGNLVGLIIIVFHNDSHINSSDGGMDFSLLNFYEAMTDFCAKRSNMKVNTKCALFLGTGLKMGDLP